MTYRQLAAKINKLTDEEKDCDVTIYISELDEIYKSDDRFIPNYGDDRLDPGHYIIMI